MVHQFKDEFEKGKRGEAELDAHFAAWCDIAPATDEEQRRGIDRWLTNRESGQRRSVEYKTDHEAARTGNAFIETVSVDTANKPGWAYTCEAEWLVYYCPGYGGEQAYWINLYALRRELARWVNQHPHRTAMNDGYRTKGVLVPLAEMEQVAEKVINIGGGVGE